METENILMVTKDYREGETNANRERVFFYFLLLEYFFEDLFIFNWQI